LKVIEATGALGVDLSWLNGNYQRALFHHVRKSPVIRLRELAEPRRRAELVCFLWQSYSDAVDQAVDMFDKLLTPAHTQAQNELDEQLCRQRQTIQLSLRALRSIGRIILDDAILTGRSVSYVKSWAEAKMHRGGAPAPSAPAVETKNVARTSLEFIAYKAAITTLVTAMMEPVAPR
jgi:predicted transcriptional regulator